MTIGIILAGGRGSRLGPMAAQISKALVPIGNRPQVINQIEQLRKAGAGQIIVVTSKDTDWQIKGVLKRAGVDARTVMQYYPDGPVTALNTAMQYVGAGEHQDIILMFSDTVLSQSLPQGEWYGLATPPKNEEPRSYCWYSEEHHKFVDSVPPPNTPVTIGAYRFASAKALKVLIRHVTWDTDSRSANGEIGMAPLLTTAFPNGMESELFETWQDVGDLFALSNARQTRFISRAHHNLSLHDDGTITKGGVSSEELQFMNQIGELRTGGQTLFPTVYDMTNDSYTMEYVDLPTLAELWLYWPGSGDTWAKIVRSIVDRLERDLWHQGDSDPMTQDEVCNYFGVKAFKRLIQWKPDDPMIDEELHMRIARACEIIGEDTWVVGHGDLNFTNILYSLNTGSFKLLDPRGGWIPQIYEYAKLAYSPVFSAIAHDLFDDMGLFPERIEETAAVIEELTKDVDSQRLTAVVALTLLAACPLHSEPQAKMLYAHGRRMLDAVTSEKA